MAEHTDGRGGQGALVKELPTDRLLHEAQNLVTALGERALTSLTDKVGDVAKGEGTGLVKGAAEGGKALTGGGSPLKALASTGLGHLKEKVKKMLPGGDGGKGAKVKVVNIVEDIDVGVPIRVAYDQWTQFQDFPSFMKKVESVDRKSETELDWKAQVFWSHRTWHSRVIEQVPDKRIVWRSKGAKGYVDGAVTFHELGPELTRILLVLQYHPQGLFEGTGNIWRAQGRRARLELKHFRRHVMTATLLKPDEERGWRGEVRDGEVVVSDEDAREDERERGDEDEDDARGGGDDGGRGGHEEAEAAGRDRGERRGRAEDDDEYADEDAEDYADEDREAGDGDRDSADEDRADDRDADDRDADDRDADDGYRDEDEYRDEDADEDLEEEEEDEDVGGDEDRPGPARGRAGPSRTGGRRPAPAARERRGEDRVRRR
ncbi:hypothetical protein GCM10027168_32300 [Streptomyces capparidis]